MERSILRHRDRHYDHADGPYVVIKRRMPCIPLREAESLCGAVLVAADTSADRAQDILERMVRTLEYPVLAGSRHDIEPNRKESTFPRVF